MNATTHSTICRAVRQEVLVPDELERFETELLAGNAEYVAAFADIRSVGNAFLSAENEIAPGMLVRSNLINADCSAVPPIMPWKKVEPLRQTTPRRCLSSKREHVDWQATNIPGVQTPTST